MEQIRGKRLILIRGYTYRTNWTGFANPAMLWSPLSRSALRLLALGRGDYLLDFGRPLEEAAKTVKVEGLQRSLLDEWPLALVVSRSLEDAEEVMERLDQSFLKNFSARCESQSTDC